MESPKQQKFRRSDYNRHTFTLENTRKSRVINDKSSPNARLILGKTFGNKPLQSHQLDLFADWDTMKEVTEGKSQLGHFFFKWKAHRSWSIAEPMRCHICPCPLESPKWRILMGEKLNFDRELWNLRKKNTRSVVISISFKLIFSLLFFFFVWNERN